MTYVFIIVDCSGSICSSGAALMGSVNDIARDLIEQYLDEGVNLIRVICYNDNAEIYWTSGGDGFVDIPESKFFGRSNLGKAYALIKSKLDAESVPARDCAFILISDGEATDNFKKELQLLDPKKEGYRVALSLGNVHTTTERHATVDRFAFTQGLADRDDFIGTAVDYVSR